MSYYFWAPSQQNELYHYGVLGMKWGVHKARGYKRQYEVATESARLKARAANAGDPNKLALINDKPITKLSPKEQSRYSKKNFHDTYKDSEKAASNYSNTVKEINSKATRKLQKLNAKYEKSQAKADRMFDKAERKSNSFLASKRSAEKAFKKASKYQFKANKAAARGKKWYDQMTKEYKKANIYMTKENQEIGKELIRQVRANSRAMYANSYR